MTPVACQLGRVLVSGEGKTRTRPSFRPPPDSSPNLLARRAAMRPFGVLASDKTEGEMPMFAHK